VHHETYHALVSRTVGVSMTDKQKAAIFDLLRQKRVIVIRKGNRKIDGKDTQATWIAHGDNKNVIVEDFVNLTRIGLGSS
jgi:hypothetical protein